MIKSFKIFESNFQIGKICQELGINNFQIVDGLVNVDGDVDISDRLTKIPIKFGRVEGNFYCYNSKLTSLEGAPQSVGGHFNCRHSQLKSLEGAPQSVGGDFSCHNNQLTSLEGAPQRVGGYFSCYNNKLITLEGGPEIVGGDFYCHNNQLTSLEGAPQSVGGDFNCGNNRLTKFTGIPEYSLNEEKSFYCTQNPIFEIYKLFNTPKCIDLINEYGAIGDGIISRVRLEEVFLELGLWVPRNLEFRNYKLI